MSNEKYFKEVTKHYLALESIVDKEQASYLKATMYKTSYNLHKLDIKIHRSLLKDTFSFSDLEPSKQKVIWDYVFKNTEYLDIGSLAIDYFKQFQKVKSHSMKPYWPLLKSWAKYIENWVHGDMLCSLYKDILSEDLDLVYPQLEKWSKNKSPWLNRIAITSCIYHFNSKRKIPTFNKCKKLFHPHIDNDHYYLQKSIGWCLREISRAYPDDFKAYMDKFVEKLSPVAYSTSVEKVSKAQRVIYSKRRKENRKLNNSLNKG